MLPKKQQQKFKVTHFSSEDSQNTDHSMNSSLEIAETNAQNNSSNKFNQLRETMNQLFLANPELAEEIKFEQYAVDDEGDVDSPRTTGMPSSPAKMTSTGGITITDTAQSNQEEQSSVNKPSKFWSAISKEMTSPQKNTKIPSLDQINHVLNIFKMKFEKIEVQETSHSPSKTNVNPKKPKADFRIQSGKQGGDKKYSLKDGKLTLTSPKDTNASAHEEEEDGVLYYSSRKKTHLKLKKKRQEMEQEEQARKKALEAEREKLAKEMEQKQMMSTLAELDEEIMKNKVFASDDDSAVNSKNPVRGKGKGSLASRQNSIKKGDIFERLTKDFHKTQSTDEEDDPQTKRTFISPFAESLYKDMKAFGDPEAFKKVAQARIMNYKKEAKERLSKLKVLPTEGLKFSKESSRHLNMFVPDFEKTMPIQNKDAVFIINEVPKDSDEWKENPEYDVLLKFQKIKQGNIMEFWKEAKDLNQ